MVLKITVGPPRLAINQGHSVLITDRDGQIPWPSDKGLYFYDTRVISSWNIYANGEPWQLLNAGNITHYASRIFLSNRVMATEDGVIPAGTLGLGLSRSIGGGVHEDLDLVNHGMQSRALQSGDCGSLRLCGFIRSQIGKDRAPRPDRHGMVRRQVATEHDLSQPGFLSRSNHLSAQWQLLDRSMPMAASASKSI